MIHSHQIRGIIHQYILVKGMAGVTGGNIGDRILHIHHAHGGLLDLDGQVCLMTVLSTIQKHLMRSPDIKIITALGHSQRT